MTFFVQFGLLFSNMQWFVIVCLIVGLVSLFVEIFQPGFGFFGIAGVVLLIMAIILRAVSSAEEDNTLLQTFQLILFVFILTAGAFTIFLVGNKKNWWKRTSLYQLNTAVNLDHSDGTDNFSELIGKTGVAITDLRPIGKIIIDDKSYDVIADRMFIENGKTVKVIGTEGVKIIVKSIN
ncbi:MAG TPA: NfeD family protein [Clostridia bacterium]|nr:NfeD family protein [Clostridia bacterium]